MESQSLARASCRWETELAACEVRLAERERSYGTSSIWSWPNGKSVLNRCAKRTPRRNTTSCNSHQQADEAERRLQQVLADRRRISLHILNSNAELAESSLHAEQLAGRSAAN